MENTQQTLQQKLARLQWLMQRQHMQRHAAHGPMADPTRGQGRVLAVLKLQPEISTKDLSYLLGIRQQSLNELLNKLEKAEYVTRTPSEADRRVMLVKLTEKGAAVPTERPERTSLFDCLSEEEQAAFGLYLDRVITALEEQLGMDGEEDERMDWMRRRMPDEAFARMMRGRGGYGDWRGPGPEHGRGPGRGPRPGHCPPPPPPHEDWEPSWDGPEMEEDDD